jgi:peptide deformylase
MNESGILNINNKEDAVILRKKAPDFDFSKVNRKEINETVQSMRQAMIASAGIGLAANQIGLPWRLFVARDEGKFYAIFNPRIVKKSKETTEIEEGCLSVPGEERMVARPEKITLAGQDRRGKKIKISAWGMLARVFQHEIDHLNGVLIIDHGKPISHPHAGSAL